MPHAFQQNYENGKWHLVDRKPRVTIAMCVRNTERTIKEAIESVLLQDYPHRLVELIVVDGCSTDKTLSIIRDAISRNDVETKIFLENKGLGLARQMAVEAAKGDYIIWVDGDIVLSPEYVREHVEFMERNPSVGIAAGKFILKPKTKLVADLQDIDWVVGDYQKRQLSNPDARRICCAGSIYRKEAINEAGGFNEQIKGAGEDTDLGYRIRRAGWQIRFGVNATLQHRGKETWKSVWDESLWYGYGGHYILHKHRVKIPASSIQEGLQRFLIGYQLTRRKTAFLLPALYVFKRIAWSYGFLKAHVNEYRHSLHNSRLKTSRVSDSQNLHSRQSQHQV